MSFECYSQRLLNPFRGTVNCIRYRSAEAVTADGVRWDIYVSNEGLLDGGTEKRVTQVSDIRYGAWTAHDGLKRGPFYPSEEFLAMEELGARVYEHLLEVHTEAPFPFSDCFELWLLDHESRPLALIDSAVNREDINLKQSLTWTPGLDCRSTFTSTAAKNLVDNPLKPGTVPDYLHNYINSRAGNEPAAQIFRRANDGSGTGAGGINIAPGIEKRTLPGTQFPKELLDTKNHDTIHRQLLQDFIYWQAPWHLLLSTLNDDDRSILEHQARVQPMKVASRYSLYPGIVNKDVIDAARVEARLRATNPPARQKEKVLSTFYIELGQDETG